MAVVQIPGDDVGHVKLYALSTCGWCKRTREFLEALGVAYDYEYVDHLESEEKDRAIREITTWNPSCSFPTMVINNERCIVGYKENEIRGALGK